MKNHLSPQHSPGAGQSGGWRGEVGRTRMSIVRDNLMSRPGYTPYCGAVYCQRRWPRTWFNGDQFQCGCGWQSNFEQSFIEQYKQQSAALAAGQSGGET